MKFTLKIDKFMNLLAKKGVDMQYLVDKGHIAYTTLYRMTKGNKVHSKTALKVSSFLSVNVEELFERA